MKILTPDAQRQAWLAEIQPHVGEPILAIGFLTTPGYSAGLVRDYSIGKSIGMISPLAGLLFRRKKVKDRVAESSNELVAVTAGGVFLFEYPMSGQPFVVSGPPTIWTRADIRVTAEAKKKLTQRIHVQFRNGENVDYDVSCGGGAYGTFSDAMLGLLLQPIGV
ncbi:hypothetical protein BH10ACT1_BH10ACT1_06090 [soil metagenome]